MFVPKILLGAREIGEYLNISRTTLWRYCRTLECPVTLTPGGRLITSTLLLAQWKDAVRDYRQSKGGRRSR